MLLYFLNLNDQDIPLLFTTCPGGCPHRMLRWRFLVHGFLRVLHRSFVLPEATGKGTGAAAVSPKPYLEDGLPVDVSSYGVCHNPLKQP